MNKLHYEALVAIGEKRITEARACEEVILSNADLQGASN